LRRSLTQTRIRILPNRLDQRKLRPSLLISPVGQHHLDVWGGTCPPIWVARSRIIDPAEYKKYTDRIPAIFAKYGGRVLARGGRFQIMEGPEKFHRFVVVEFDTFEQGVACFQSPEYEEAAAFRRNGAGEVETIVVEGGDATPASLSSAASGGR
jgi:uncharacterized protein (DUF1330 family)